MVSNISRAIEPDQSRTNINPWFLPSGTIETFLNKSSCQNSWRRVKGLDVQKSASTCEKSSSEVNFAFGKRCVVCFNGFFISLGVFGYFVCCMLCLFCSKAITNPQSLDEIQKRRSQQHGNAFNAQIWHDRKLYLL